MDFPPIYPLLEKSAFYIGDYSSIGYDFLYFNRPLFFVSSTSTFSSYCSPLHRCGIPLHPEDLSKLKKKIHLHLNQSPDVFSEVRRQTYHYAFGNPKSFELLYKDLFQTINPL